MSRNEYGDPLDRNGYSDSIVQTDMSRCFLCGRRDRKLDRHEVFGSSMRDKSKRLGLWVLLCHDACHQGEGGVHKDADTARRLKKKAQQAAMNRYGWSETDWHREFGKSFSD